MAEKTASYTIAFDGDAGNFDRILAGIKSSVSSAVLDIQRAASKLDLFGALQNSIPGVERALDSAKQKVQQFTAEIAKIEATGGKAPKELAKALGDAEKAAAAATRELAKQQAQVATLAGQLAKAGVSTKDLAGEQTRLATAYKAAADAAALQAAKQQLGLVTMKDIQAEAARLTGAFATLKSSGVLSMQEISAAQTALRARMQELSASVSGAGGAFAKISAEGKAALTGLIGPALGLTGALAGTIAGLRDIVAANQAFNSGLRAISVATTATQGQINALGGAARKLATDLGLDLTEALKGVRDLIRGGIAPDNAIDALRVSAIGAKAAMTDLEVGVKAAGVLTSAFGIPVKELGAAFDVLTVAAKNGGPSLEEFASSAGNLGVIAKSTGQNFQQVIAALTVMTSATGNASESASTLQKILVALDTGEVQKRLRDLGVEGQNIFDVFRQLDAKGLHLNEFFELGIANTRAAAGVAALKTAATGAPQLLKDLAQSAGASAKEAAKFFDSASERIKRMQAAFNDLKLTVGLTSDGLGQAATRVEILLRALDRLAAKGKEQSGLDNIIPALPLVKLVLAIQQVQKEVDVARSAFLRFGEGAEDQVSRAAGAAERYAAIVKQQADEAERAMKGLREDAAELVTLAEKSRAVAAELLAENATREKAAIELIQRTTEAKVAALAEQQRALEQLGTAETQAAQDVAAATIRAQESLRLAIATSQDQILAIQVKAAKDRLDIIKANEAEVSRAITAALELRIQEAGENKAKRDQLELEFGRLQVDNTKKALELYRAHYNDLVGLNRTYIDKIKSIEGERVSFNKSIQDAIREVQNRTLTGAEQYQAKILQIEDTINRAQQARLNGNRELERQFTQEAIAGARSLAEVTDKTGKVVVTQQKAQRDSLTLLDQLSDQYTDSLDEQEGAAKKGAKATQDGLNATKPIIDDLQKKFDALLKTVANGVTLKINEDIQNLDKVEAKLNDVGRTRVVRFVADTSQVNNDFSNVQTVGPTVPVRGFAAGGPVFNPLRSLKVPGVGNADTHPALLSTGSFVLRKAASQFYGDGLLSALANVRKFATGGPVEPGPDNVLTVIEYAKALLPYLRKPIWETSVKILADNIKALGQNPGNKGALEQLLALSKYVAASYPLQDFHGNSLAISVSKPLIAFEDFVEQLKVVGKRRTSTGKSQPTFSGPLARRFADGGGVGTDTVRALLTPGEFVFNPSAVRMIGTDFLHAMNNLQLRPPARPQHFATGGLVPGAASTQRGAATVGGDFHVHVTVNAAGAGADDPRVIDKITDAITQKMRRAGQRFA